MHTESELHADMVTLITQLIPEIGDEYRAYECECRMENDTHDEDCAPSMLVTVGADADGWAYQTGDNSYSGGAYGYATWAVVSIDRASNPSEVADSIISELYELAPDDAPIFIPSDELEIDASNGGQS